MDIVRFALLGLGIGAVYALLAQGLVLIYRGSGVVNFGHGALAMVGAFVYDELVRTYEWDQAPAAIVGVLVGALLGAATHLLIMRPLRTAAPLAKVIATLGLMIIVQAAATLIFGTTPRSVEGFLPDDPLDIGSVTIAADRLWLLGIAVALTVLLTVTFRFTQLGLATRAMAENQRALASLGWSPDLIAALNWSLGGALAAFAGILIVPLTGLQVATLTSLVIVAMAVALLASFTSFPLAMIGGVALGIAQSELNRYVDQQGISHAAPFLMIMLVMVVRGKGLPLRGSLVEHKPVVSSGRIRWAVVAPASLAVAVLAVAVLNEDWQAVLTYSCVISIVLLSVVVLTGYAGQLSLAQFTFAGIGAYFSGRLVAAAHWPFELALLAGIAGAAVVGALFALPALRTRGVNLAVVTLGLGSAVQAVLFNNSSYTGGETGTVVGTQTFFGVELDAVASPGRYAVFTLIWLLLAMAVVSNLRRSASGRRLLAVRTNERAAAALGVNVFRAKMFAFTLSAALAGLAGTLLAFTAPTITYDVSFDPLHSITSITLAVVGGVGFLSGPLYGSALSSGGVGSLLNEYLAAIESWLVLIGGVLLILLLLQDANGMAAHNQKAFGTLMGRIRGSRSKAAIGPSAPGPAATKANRAGEPAPRPAGYSADAVGAAAARDSARPRADLVVEGLTVRYGTVVAVSDFDLTVRPGEVHGLIGPNGAGKTSVIDAVSGFARAGGSVRLGSTRLDSLPVYQRSLAGVARSFQSLELFEDLTVRENLLAADHQRSLLGPVRDLIRPARQELPPSAVDALREFDLMDCLDEPAGCLPYGRRRLVAIVRALASGPAVLMLDEPAAGLDESESVHLGRLVRQLADTWGIGVMLVEHDMSVVMSVCDRVTVVEFGRRIAVGSPAEVSRDPAVRAAYLGEADTPAPAGEVPADQPVVLPG
ncbi:hypothetical protein CcI49_29075 [Frankia sp. CcI49]|uniref:ABC transporter permease subunit n=1 Tax=Frankia sp. CcI49 TaxID=1745382 RepID=UPI000978A987|nr:ATP-binding cassette domain-containing protein [Frankia sp. CcI49]ONH55558.1 hypothetical protein CcI49_29075 [Frankia sp. CcI49]